MKVIEKLKQTWSSHIWILED